MIAVSVGGLVTVNGLDHPGIPPPFKSWIEDRATETA
jgi:hypothetical protein